MEMIEKLEPVFEKCSDGVGRQFPPRPYDMMYKINELVEAVNRMEKQIEKQKETQMPDSTQLIEMWDQEKALLKEKDFRGDEWRLAYNAFMDGFARGTCVKFDNPKEQKHAEWSEEDDQLIGFIFDLLNSLVWRKEWAMDKKECLERLKSLRLSWKPSKEQMDAIDRCVDYLEESDNEDAEIMESLYNDLKKLI